MSKLKAKNIIKGPEGPVGILFEYDEKIHYIFKDGEIEVIEDISSLITQRYTKAVAKTLLADLRISDIEAAIKESLGEEPSVEASVETKEIVEDKVVKEVSKEEKVVKENKEEKVQKTQYKKELKQLNMEGKTALPSFRGFFNNK